MVYLDVLGGAISSVVARIRLLCLDFLQPRLVLQYCDSMVVIADWSSFVNMSTNNRLNVSGGSRRI